MRQSAAVQLAVTTFGVVWIGLGFGFLVAIRDIPAPSGWGRELLLAVLLGVWGSDIAAYGAGRMFGRRKLAAQISPNKTVEGLIAGLIAGTAIVFFTLYHQPHSDPLSPLHAQDEIRRAGLYRELWQSFCVLPDVHAVGVQGDDVPTAT